MISIRDEVDPNSLIDTLGRCAGVSVQVLGDLMLDEYVSGAIERISPEAPVPIVRAEMSELRLGGAANVARQIAALGAKVTLIGIVGEDTAGDAVRRLCVESGISTESILTVRDRPTTRKLRVLSQSQQLLRVDWEDRRPVSERDADALLGQLGHLPLPDAIILSDYAKGVPVEARDCATDANAAFPDANGRR
jgi:rfaE bifunctional protein kinase chain/domain